MYLRCTWVRNLSRVGAQAAADRGAEAGRRAPQKGLPSCAYVTWADGEL